MTQAIILAGGEGKRMAGTDGDALKSAVKIQGKTLLEWQLEQLERSGIKKVTIYTSEVTPQGALDEYARSTSNLGIDIDIKEKPLKIGSLGCVKDALLEIPADEDLVVLYGDIFSDINLGTMLERHQKSGFLATLAKIKGDHVPYGMIEDDSNGLITSFKEKGDLQYNSGIAVVKGE